MNLESLATVRAAVVLALACAATPAFSSANLIQNGDFSTGDLSGWNISGQAPDVVNGAAQWITRGDSLFSQTFATTIGTDYKIEFQLGSTNSTFDIHRARWNGQGLTGAFGGGPFATTDFSFVQAADATISTLEFMMGTYDGVFTLDNVSVVALSPVPELETAPMLVFGMALLSAMARRRQTKAVEATDSHST